jgi:hypothetical protein
VRGLSVMEEQKQYNEELLEWCNNIYSNWEIMKPRFSKLFNLESLEEWEGSCRQLKEKLQADLRVDFDDYQAAKSLYEQWEQLFKVSSTYQEELEADADNRLEMEEQQQFHNELLETNAYPEELEVDADNRLEVEEQQQFHDELLEKNAYQEELEVDSDNRLELEVQQQFHDELLETNAYQEELEVDSDNRLELEVQKQFHKQLLEMDTYQETIEVETDKGIELEEQLNNVKIYCNGVITFIIIGKS